MAQNEVLYWEGLQLYDTRIKEKIASDDASTLQNAKLYADGLSVNYDPSGTAETKVEELASGQVATNTSNISALQSGKADKATTLEGYGITDAYTKQQTDSAISTAIANADHLKREIVSSLPEKEEADEHTIYMVGSGAGSQDSVYKEYMIINGEFEIIGSTEVDLTNYALKTYVDQAKQDVQGYVDSLASNYATADQGTRADTALQKADIASGGANGTISVDGTDVPVKGLDSAAFKASGSASGNVPVNGSDLGTTANVPVVTNTSGQLIPHASGALGTAAFSDTSSFEVAGAVQSLENGQVATNKTNIEALQTKVSNLESKQFTAITEEQINSLFTE